MSDIPTMKDALTYSGAVSLDDTAQMLLYCLLCEDDLIKIDPNEIPPLMLIIRSRIPESIRDQYENKLLLFCSHLAQGNPGKAVVWAWTLVKDKIKDIKTLVQHFPDGFPTQEGFVHVWDAQKDDDGWNRLDDPDVWGQVAI